MRLKKACGTCPLSFDDWSKLMVAAARFPARSDPANSQLDPSFPLLEHARQSARSAELAAIMAN